MVKTVKDFPFSIAQKISEEDSIVWLKESNKYIILNSTILALIKKKSALSSKDFIALIIESFQVNSIEAIKINKNISELLLEAKEVDLKKDTKHPDIVKSCELIQYYSFNDIIIKVCFDTEETKLLIHQKYSHLVVENKNICNVEFKIFNSNNTLFILKNNQVIGSWVSNQSHEFQGKFSMELICSFYNKTEHDWMGVFHASTISKNNHSVMFTGYSRELKENINWFS